MITKHITSPGDLFALAALARQHFEDHDVWFRGQEAADPAWALLPKVKRGWSRNDEINMSDEFMLKAKALHPVCPDALDLPGWLCLMQHYGLPTRLLDWSQSILVAGFFAVVAKQAEGDALIWALAPALLNETQGRGQFIFTMEAAAAKQYCEASFKRGRDGGPFVEPGGAVAAMSPHIDLRMMLQQAAFTIHGDGPPLDHMPDHERFPMKLVIPERARGNIAVALQSAGIRRSAIFPDLSALAQDIESGHPPQSVTGLTS